MTAFPTTTLNCDWHHCKEAFNSIEPEAPRAREHAARNGWGFGNHIDLCPTHKAAHETPRN